MTDPGPETGRDVAGWAQVFGSAFTVISATVLAATLANATAAVLVATAGIALSAAVLLAFGRRTRTRRTWLVIAGCAVTTLVTAGAAAVLAAEGRAPDHPSTSGNPADPALLISASDYPLTPSSSIFTNDRDKIDLDTACPGHGPTKPQVGPSRCGENADLILNETELLSWERLPRLVLTTEAPTYSTCRKLLTSTGGVGSIDLDDLSTDSTICVSTDKNNIAAVRITDITRGAHLVIDAEVWPTPR